MAVKVPHLKKQVPVISYRLLKSKTFHAVTKNLFQKF